MVEQKFNVATLGAAVGDRTSARFGGSHEVYLPFSRTYPQPITFALSSFVWEI